MSLFAKLSELFGQASLILMALVVLSVLVLGVGLERLLYTWRFRHRLKEARSQILAQLRLGQQTMAQAVNTSLPWHPGTPLFSMVLGTTEAVGGTLRRAQGKALREVKRRLWLLASIGAIAPFVGLLGTVLGVMEAFRAIGDAGTGGFQVVSSGISEALITTAAGIFVGVEAVLLFNYLQICVAECAALLRESVEEIDEAREGMGHGAAGT